jgi:N-methylhydantoinase A
VSLSSEVFPAIREYERTNTTVIDAFLSPGVRKYLDGLEEYLRGNGFSGALRLVHAAGGVSTPDEVRKAPVTLINSGPVAGYVGAMKFGIGIGRRNIITADVGGTSFDTGVIRDGRLALRHRTSVPAPGHPSPGYPTGLSMMDVSAIGTGGGSIGWVDTRGIIRVGPRSAGSNPGPACFGRGGDEPTLTDACVVLGLLDPDHFLGGSQKLDPEAARRTVRANLMEPLGLPDVLQPPPPCTAWPPRRGGRLHRQRSTFYRRDARQRLPGRGADIPRPALHRILLPARPYARRRRYRAGRLGRRRHGLLWRGLPHAVREVRRGRAVQ